MVWTAHYERHVLRCPFCKTKLGFIRYFIIFAGSRSSWAMWWAKNRNSGWLYELNGIHEAGAAWRRRWRRSVWPCQSTLNGIQCGSRWTRCSRKETRFLQEILVTWWLVFGQHVFKHSLQRHEVSIQTLWRRSGGRDRWRGALRLQIRPFHSF